VEDATAEVFFTEYEFHEVPNAELAVRLNGGATRSLFAGSA
jgi:hypothetical protein